MITFLLIFGLGSTFFLLFYCILEFLLRNREAIRTRLDKIKKDSGENKPGELNQSLFIRVIKPFLDDISRTIMKATPKEFNMAFERKVIRAGSPFGFSAKDWISLQAAVILCLPLVTITIGYYANASMKVIGEFSLLEMCAGLMLPNILLGSKAGSRQKQIRNSLPDILDLLTVSVEAGLGFDGALAKVVDKMPGALADEFSEVLQEIKVGKQKRDALRDMAERVGVQDLTTFVGSIVQADQLGVSIGNVLRLQAEQMRQKRRQRAQEKAMKAPVKMLIPMVLFIFPTIFSVLIGPVAIKVFRMLSK